MGNLITIFYYYKGDYAILILYLPFDEKFQQFNQKYWCFYEISYVFYEIRREFYGECREYYGKMIVFEEISILKWQMFYFYENWQVCYGKCMLFCEKSSL